MDPNARLGLGAQIAISSSESRSYPDVVYPNEVPPGKSILAEA
jgi:hypothetical protein